MVDLLLRSTIWRAVLAWMATEWLRLRSPRETGDLRARALWTTAAFLAVAHVALALHFRHGWSQTAAWAETARQTREMLGLYVGWGLLVNYNFLVVWVTDAAWWWWRPASFSARPRALGAAIPAFLLFIVVNGTLVFGHGPVRVLGVLALASLAIAWFRAPRGSDELEATTQTGQHSRVTRKD